ncbi:MAG: M12 family metallo-peptidase, partial [Bacteroidota bacterium]
MKKLIITVLVLFFNELFIAQHNGDYLFTKLNKKDIKLTASEKARFTSALNREINSQEYEIVIFNDLNSLDKKEEIKINLGKKGDVVLYYKSMEEDILGNITYVYKVDYESYAIITVSNSTVSAFFQLGDEVFNIEPLGNRHSLLTKVDNEKAITAVKHGKDYYEELRDKENPIGLLKSGEASSVEGLIVIDLLVAYTPAAASAAGDISSLISLAIAQANTTYHNSGINVSLNLAYATQVSYTESGTTETDCYRLTETDDGYMDGIHSLRTQYNADVCVLLISTGDYAGWARFIPADYSTAFCAVRYDYAVNEITFTHEIGHLQGARHQYKLDDGNPLYAHGYYHYDNNPVNRWRTVMAAFDEKYGNTSNRIPYWSDPNSYYSGSVLGIADTANNKLRLNNTAYTIASLSDPVNISGSVVVNTTLTGNVHLIGNVTVNNGITLTLSSNATINLNGFSIESNGGTITIQSGATFYGLLATLKLGSDIKGIYPTSYTVQQLIDLCSSGWSINLVPGTYTENLNMKAGVTVTGSGPSSTTINGTVTFSSADYSSLKNAAVNGKISINNSSSVVIDNVKANNSNCYIDAYGSSVTIDDF